MSTWGFEATNNAGQVLVSSETRNLHFVGKAALSVVANQFDTHGGLRQFQFTIACNVPPVPFFTMPTDDYYGVSAVREIDTGQWMIEVIRSGTSATQPEVYVFADPRGTTARNSNYGMLVLRDDGTPSFDSRLSPLTVTGGMHITHPSNPRPTFPYALDARYCHSSDDAAGGHFAPTELNTFSLLGQPSKPMFSYASIAQAEREARYHDSDEECLGSDKLGICVTRTVYDWNSRYWAFYRGGVRWTGTAIEAGWIVVAFGCNWDYNQDDSLIGIGIGGDSGGGGTWPYSNETINLTATSVIVADSTRYDD